MMMKAARALRATKNAVLKLILKYEEWDALIPMDVANVQLNYPYIRSFSDINNNVYEFMYLGQCLPDHLIYRAKITHTSGNLVNELSCFQFQMFLEDGL
jgi:hypothetical protein